MNKKVLGQKSEELAAGWLFRKGYEVLERNFRTRIGEVDIIAYKDMVLYFAEVRSSHRGCAEAKTDVISLGVQAIGRRKLSRIARVGETWAQKKGYVNMDMDILVIQVNWYNQRRAKIQVIPVY